VARPKRGDEQQQKPLYLLGNCGVLLPPVIPPTCTTAKEVSRSLACFKAFSQVGFFAQGGIEAVGSVVSFKDRPKPEVVSDAFESNRIDRLHPYLSFRNGPTKKGIVNAGKCIGGGNISEITVVNEAIA
jgi:hypothetical protein